MLVAYLTRLDSLPVEQTARKKHVRYHTGNWAFGREDRSYIHVVAGKLMQYSYSYTHTYSVSDRASLAVVGS